MTASSYTSVISFVRNVGIYSKRGTVAHFRIPVLEYRWNKISSSPTHNPAEAGYDEGKCPLTLFQVNFPDSYSRINLHFRVLKYVSQRYIIISEYKRLPLIIFRLLLFILARDYKCPDAAVSYSAIGTYLYDRTLQRPPCEQQILYGGTQFAAHPAVGR